MRIGDPTLPFTASVIENQAIMEWTATVGGAAFVSDPARTSHSAFAEIGHERNGIFFAQGDQGGLEREGTTTSCARATVPPTLRAIQLCRTI